MRAGAPPRPSSSQGLDKLSKPWVWLTRVRHWRPSNSYRSLTQRNDRLLRESRPTVEMPTAELPRWEDRVTLGVDNPGSESNLERDRPQNQSDQTTTFAGDHYLFEYFVGRNIRNQGAPR